MTGVKVSVAAGAVQPPGLAASSSPAPPGTEEVQHEAPEIPKIIHTALSYQRQNLHVAFETPRRSAEVSLGRSQTPGKAGAVGSEWAQPHRGHRAGREAAAEAP